MGQKKKVTKSSYRYVVLSADPGVSLKRILGTAGRSSGNFARITLNEVGCGVDGIHGRTL